MDPKEFREWLIEQRKLEYFPYLWYQIENKLNAYTNAALQAGDTEFAKGQVAALTYVKQLPENLAIDDNTDTNPV
jgi:hypothetical protein